MISIYKSFATTIKLVLILVVFPQSVQTNLIVFHPSVYNSIFIQVIFQIRQKSTAPNQTQTQPHQTNLIHTKMNSTTPDQTHPY